MEVITNHMTNRYSSFILHDACPFILCSSFSQRFIQYMASRTSNFSLGNFLDKSGVQGE